MELIDTHCHIHFPDYGLDPEVVVQDAVKAGVKRLICVGCTLTDSKLAIRFAAKHDNVWASVGLHPHEAKNYVDNDEALQSFRSLVQKPKVVAIGECGLDYHYNHSSPDNQKRLLRFQLDLALEHHLPLIFHVREAYDDFWPIFDSYKGQLTGVLHSFTDNQQNLDKALGRGLFIGVNGIATFVKDPGDSVIYVTIPQRSLLLETDAPFLTPSPYRGTICQPKHVRVTAEFLANLRGEPVAEIAAASTENACNLFHLR